MNKLLAMNAAAVLTSAVISNLPDELKRDVDIKDPDLQAENLMTWEVFRIFYHAVVKASGDDQNWPAPQGDAANIVGDIAGQLMPLIGRIIDR